MNRAAARCWQACGPDKRPILSHRQMTHRQAPKTKQTCLGFGQGLPESRTLRTLGSSPTGGKSLYSGCSWSWSIKDCTLPRSVDPRSELMEPPSGARPVVPDALAWQGHGREGRGRGAGRGQGARRRPTGRRRVTWPRPGATIPSALCSCSFGLRLPTSGAVVLGLTDCPPR